jgi:hypothetical protein
MTGMRYVARRCRSPVFPFAVFVTHTRSESIATMWPTEENSR